jgi:endonuclease YncB( thermonuclease family)
MIRFGRLCSLSPNRHPVGVVFAAGLATGMAAALAVQSRPAPAASQSAPAQSTPEQPIDAEVPAGLPSRSRNSQRPPPPIPADVLRVIDGDTFEARVHVWPGLDVTTKVRLRGIDAPELRARCPAERIKAEAARDALGEILGQGAVGVYEVSIDKYGGRVVAEAATRALPSVSAELLGHGHARPYKGGHREGWCDGSP